MSSELLGKSIVCIYLYVHHPFPLQQYLSHFQETVHLPCLPHLSFPLAAARGLEAWVDWGTRFTNPFCRSPLFVCSTSRGGLRGSLPPVSLFCLHSPFQATVPPSSGCSGLAPGPRAGPLQDQEGTAGLKARDTRGGWGEQLPGEVGREGAQGGGACLSCGQGWGSLASAHPCRLLEELARARGSALSPGRQGVMMLLTVSRDAHRASLPRRKYLRRWHLEALLRRLQGSQQARRLAGTWQCWVDAQGAEELARSLVSGEWGGALPSHTSPSCYSQP